MKKLIKFLADKRGNFAITFGLTIMPVMFLTGMAIDYSEMQRHRWRLQETADASALYATKQLEQAGRTENDLLGDAKNVVASDFDIEGDPEVDLDKKANRLTVTLHKFYQPTFLSIIDQAPIKIGVLAEVAYDEVFEGAKCFVSLSESGSGVLTLNGNSKIDAKKCGVHVNSDSSKAVDLNGSNTEIESESNCFVGGVDSGLGRIQPPPETSCAILPDPFNDYDLPTVGNCTYTDYKVNANRTVTLNPGVYCGGLSIGSGAQVTFSPGLYIIKNGAFKTTGSSHLEGEGVSFYFTGDDIAVNFSGGTTFHLVAMETGDMAGFIFFFDPNSDMTKSSEFSGNSNTYFEGLMYFGNRDLRINGSGEVNTGSPFSSIVANTITLNGSATLNFNIDAAHTDVPIPEELYEKSITAYLVR
ncbi:MAG: Tad domain-containing protein [Nitratireductor sp.]